ncbi:Small glutamine-rich tetratricopeptide repeat-containing protein beta [Eumeta japonica]|uniref:Small glutamine-rich tetratricopeptide repeat-containing protein beta n=1 Tax=Eumeta variegata TaxID=151549 RepID=A0A4C1Y2R1_EUMVA|nr:Small glutamine-rich tetratricopeptide repeat-containing protein beta [Eumeta japonica]
MSEVKLVVASVITFLKQQLEGDTLSVDSRESVEVAVQCLESAFDVGPADAARSMDLLKLVREQTRVYQTTQATPPPPVLTPEQRVEAERLKNEGNELMKAEKYKEALELYTRAIEMDARNPVYYCNRAAAHFKLEEHEAAVVDCTAALALQPNYTKAHGRLGLALTALERHREARAAYARAAELEPENESYRVNLRLTDEKLAQLEQRPPLDFASLLHNPALLNMATQMLSDPNMQNLISNLMGSSGGAGGLGGEGAGAGGMGALLEAGQMLAQHMQSANPELVDQLRRQVGSRAPPGDPPAPQQ